MQSSRARWQAACRVLTVLASLAMSAAAATPAAGGADGSDVVVTTSGAVRGLPPDANGVTAYLGVPFAEPPVGPLRWQPPVPRAAWSGVWNANQSAPACLQAQEGSSEDCLYLSVYVPTLNSSAPPPAVMVWIYGGEALLSSRVPCRDTATPCPSNTAHLFRAVRFDRDVCFRKRCGPVLLW
jgi:para-nitrobenzyl esterase